MIDKESEGIMREYINGRVISYSCSVDSLLIIIFMLCYSFAKCLGGKKKLKAINSSALFAHTNQEG